jgi:class 3 adenylate cyclase
MWTTYRGVLVSFRGEVEALLYERDDWLQQSAILARSALDIRPGDAKWVMDFGEDTVRLYTNLFHQDPRPSVRSEVVKLFWLCECRESVLDAQKQLFRDAIYDSDPGIVRQAIRAAGDLQINDSTMGGRILLMFLVLAILSIPLSMSIYQAWRFARTNKDLALQLKQVQALSEKTLQQEKEKQLMLENRKEELEREVEVRTHELKMEKKKSDDLLLNILPSETAEELKETGAAQAKSFPAVTVMFTDFKDFTRATEKLSAESLVKEINTCYSAFDEIISRHSIEKIKTMGDSYMCAGGLPVNNDTHPDDVILAALEMQEFIRVHMDERKRQGLPFFEIRLGIERLEDVVRARVHADAGRPTEAYHDLGQSVSVFELLGERHQAGLSYLELGRLAVAAGARSRATRYLTDAIAIFEALGAAPDLAEARQAIAETPPAAVGGYVGVQMDGEDALVRLRDSGVSAIACVKALTELQATEVAGASVLWLMACCPRLLLPRAQMWDRAGVMVRWRVGRQLSLRVAVCRPAVVLVMFQP